MKTILPKELVEHTLEVHRHSHSKKNRKIYLLLILFLLCTLAALPLIKFDIYSSSPGMIRTETKKIQMSVPQSGRIVEIRVFENKRVFRGDTLLILDESDLSFRDSLVSAQIDSINVQIQDLDILSTANHPFAKNLSSKLYVSSFHLFEQGQKRLERERHQYKTDYLRQKYLFEKGVISSKELETSLFNYKVASDELDVFRSRQKSVWREELHQIKQLRSSLLSSLVKIRNAKKNLTITSPINGYVQDLRGFETDTYLQTGALLFNLIPETGLIVECLVSPDEIWAINIDQEVKYQISASDRQDFAGITGKVISISQDISQHQGHPLFEVRCSIDPMGKNSDSLYVRKLKRGMTLIAKFRLARRSAFDLLVDRAEELQKINS